MAQKMQSQAGGDPEEIIGNYKRMMAECQQIAQKINEVCMPSLWEITADLL